jgi:glycosyltransferase involved in cell wall biosynthesis
MKISFSATNPCHIYDQALGVHERGALGTFYCGYPRWRLKAPGAMPVVSLPWRTMVTYGLQRLPEWARPPDHPVFRWQDRGFDRAVSRILDTEGTDILHGIPGQALGTFRRARELGIPCVLNHASGPLEVLRELIRPEYERRGMNVEEKVPVPRDWAERLEGEMKLADWHCVASTIVRDQLAEKGVDPSRIWVVPYGVNGDIFPKRPAPPDGPFRICFAGRQSLLKGVKYLLDALETVGEPDWELHVFGMSFGETARDFAAYKGRARVIQHGAVSQAELAGTLRTMHVFVLPSAAEAFGLVVVQALQSGVPCIVSDRVGAKDLIRPGRNGTVFPFGNVEALSESLLYWNGERGQVVDCFPRSDAARLLIDKTQESLAGIG